MQKIMKNYDFSLKNTMFFHYSRLSFVKNRKIIIARISGDGRSHFHEKFDLHTGVSILSDQKYRKNHEKLRFFIEKYDVFSLLA